MWHQCCTLYLLLCDSSFGGTQLHVEFPMQSAANCSNSRRVSCAEQWPNPCWVWLCKHWSLLRQLISAEVQTPSAMRTVIKASHFWLNFNCKQLLYSINWQQSRQLALRQPTEFGNTRQSSAAQASMLLPGSTNLSWLRQPILLYNGLIPYWHLKNVRSLWIRLIHMQQPIANITTQCCFDALLGSTFKCMWKPVSAHSCVLQAAVWYRAE